jgi:hypothetical protein
VEALIAATIQCVRTLMRMRFMKAWRRDAARGRKVLAGAISLMMNHKLSMAWERWQEWYAVRMSSSGSLVLSVV